MKDREQIIKAVIDAVQQFDQIEWGWDGDCGSAAIIDRLVEQVIEED